jgi:ribosomal protein L15
LASALESSKMADMEKGDISITQKDDEVKVLGDGRLQSN